jgi:CheY-like chemotaxis protein
MAESGASAADMRMSVLLVDDRLSDLLALETVLASPEYDLVTASSGVEALRVWEQRDFAVVLLDLYMPHMDGFETALQMKRKARNGRPTPIIFVTAVDSDREHK